MKSQFTTAVVVVIIIFAVVTFVGTLSRALFYSTDAALIPPPLPSTAPTSSEPVRLSIPALDVDAQVQQVGVNAKGEMGIPSNFKDVAWYRLGTVPGQLGSAVIAGHLDNGLGLPGVFKELGNLKKGDEVLVTARDGSILRFIVEDVAHYPYDASPLQKIFAQKDAAWLNLITCSGDWIKGKQTYSERIVVYTRYVNSVDANQVNSS
jgi:LPXTG-site transpeptidase (sortase) family protein